MNKSKFVSQNSQQTGQDWQRQLHINFIWGRCKYGENALYTQVLENN